jgi:hypothetical protein
MERIVQRVHINTHIEKTAGTSLQEFFTRFYGPQNAYIYSSDTDTLVRANRLIMKARTNTLVDRIRYVSKQLGLTALAHSIVINHLSNHSENHHLNQLPKNCLFIHGHFVADYFDKFGIKQFRTIILRDPLERTISHYKYWKEARGVTNHRVQIPFDERMDFRDFALLGQMCNFQTTAFGGLKIYDFDLVGVTQNIELFTDKFLSKSPRKGVYLKMT